jgi:hypothetical protein
VVEVGAGTGYWAALLRARGVDVVAYDVRPPQHLPPTSSKKKKKKKALAESGGGGGGGSGGGGGGNECVNFVHLKTSVNFWPCCCLAFESQNTCANQVHDVVSVD